MESKKISPEQLQSLHALQDEWDQRVRQYGELHLQKKLVEQEILSVEDAFVELDQRRAELVQKLQEQFGSTGTINLQTGEFHPD